jgi:dihydroxy-acid dehydratase
VDFTMADIDALRRKVPVLCKVAPAVADVHMEDVHRAGGIPAILGQLDRAGLLDTTVPTIHSRTLAEGWTAGMSAAAMPRASPNSSARPRRRAHADRLQPVAALEGTGHRPRKGVIRSAENAFSKDGGLAVLFGNLAPEGCIVKTAGVDESILTFKAPPMSSKARTPPSWVSWVAK